MKNATAAATEEQESLNGLQRPRVPGIALAEEEPDRHHDRDHAEQPGGDGVDAALERSSSPRTMPPISMNVPRTLTFRGHQGRSISVTLFWSLMAFR